MSDFMKACEMYMESGWHPIPVYPKSKIPVPGVTGWKGSDLSMDELAKYDAERNYNLGVRMPVGVLGIDVDGYKNGLETLADLEEAYGKLPDTFVSSARFDTDPASGIRYYRIPDDSVLIDEIENGGIEFIQRHHRFAMVFPTIHPVLGKRYEWKNSEVPDVKELPWIG